MASRWSVPGYEEIRDLGTGATGRVVLARHDGSGRLVAIKYLAPQLVREPGFPERFRQEAETLARLRDPHIVQLLDYVETRDGAAIVMEAVEGPTLRGLLLSNGPCPPEAALTVLQGSLLGLAAAHAQGVVHRDYKPENVLVDAAGDSKLADFGVAAPAGRDTPGHGTPAYMAPEQWNGMRATPATDMYAASVVFFEALVGQRPFSSDTMAGLRRAHEAAPVPVEQAPEPVRPLLTLGLSKDPEQRYQDVPSFLAHLERVAVAGYGADWKERGTRDLAVAAAALIAAFPLLALSGGAGAGAGAAGAASGAAGSGAAGAPALAPNAAEVARQGLQEAHEVGRAGAEAGRSSAQHTARSAAQRTWRRRRSGAQRTTTRTHSRLRRRWGRAATKAKVGVAAAGLAVIATTTTVVVAIAVPAGEPKAAASAPSVAGSGTTSAPGAASTSDASDASDVSSADTPTPTPTGGASDPSAPGAGATTSDSSASTSGSTSSTSSSSNAGSTGSAGSTSSASATATKAKFSSASPEPPSSGPSTSAPPPPPPTTPAPPPTTPSTPLSTPTVAAAVSDPAVVGSKSMCGDKGLHISVTGRIFYSGAAPASVVYVWTRSDGSQSSPQTVAVSGGAATVTDSFTVGAGGWDQLSVGTVTSAHASYTVNCVTGTLSAQSTTAACSLSPGQVLFSGTISGTPGTTVRWYSYVAFSVGTPTSTQGGWASVTLDARGNGLVRFVGSRAYSTTMTGSVMVDPMDGGKPFQLASAVGTLTCAPG